MVILVENDVVEFGNLKYIKVLCRNCNQELADFVHVKPLKNVWEIDINDMNWDAKFKVHSHHIFCECGEKSEWFFNVVVFIIYLKN